MSIAVDLPGRNGGDPHLDPEPETNVYDVIAAAINDVPGEIARLDAERKRVAQRFQDRIDVLVQERQAAVAGFDDQRGKLNKLLKAMGHEPIPVEVEHRRSGRPSKRNGEVTLADRKMSAEKALKACEVLLTQGDDLFTAYGIHEAAGRGWAQTSTNGLFKYLRHREILGFVRMEARRRGRGLYRILDRDKMVEWKQELETEIAQKKARS